MKYILASLAASAVTVSALELFPGHQYIKRDLAARQTDDSDSYGAYYSDYLACATALQSVYDDLPTPAPVLASYVATATADDACSVTYPASIESAVSSYASAVEDWYSSNSDEIESALSECTAYTDVGETTFSDACTTALTGGGGAGGRTSATTTADGTAATESATTTSDAATDGTGPTATPASAATSAGHRDTGAMAAAIMAVVGVLGVVAVL